MKYLAFLGLGMLLHLIFLSPALADSSHCDMPDSTALNIAKTMATAQSLKDTLNQRNDNVVLLVRQGQAMDSYHLRYSHAAWAVRLPNGHWQVFHNLNECGSGHSSLYVQGLYEFLSDGLVRQEIAILRPSIILQQRLMQVLANNQRLNLLHSSQYNLVAYPFSGPWQNSNGWVLEVFALANQTNVWSRNDARAWLKAQHYQPSELSVSFLERTTASLFAPHITTDDQPDSLLDNGKIQINSGDSIIHFIARYSQPMTDCDHQDWGNAVCVFSPALANRS